MYAARQLRFTSPGKGEVGSRSEPGGGPVMGCGIWCGTPPRIAFGNPTLSF